ncbi:MAG: outer membrane beta-barrel protein [Betaproteobacteria bacterium]
MKKIILPMLLGAALCSPWPALAESAYLKLGIGQSRYSSQFETFRERALTVAYGAPLDSTWGYEVGYIHFGDINIGGPGPLAIGLRSQAFYAAGVANVSLNTATRAYTKVGLALVNSKASLAVGQQYEGPMPGNTTNLMAGVGLDYKLSPQIAANIEYQYFGAADQVPYNLSSWTVGLSYGF